METLSDSNLKNFIQYKVNNGEYKTVANHKGRSQIWKKFCFIKDPAKENFLKNYICCGKCKKVYLNRTRHVTNLRRHKCFNARNIIPISNGTEFSNITLSNEHFEKEQNNRKLINDAKENVKNGLYSICSKERDNDPVWKLFGNVLDNNGTTLDNLIGCRQCNSVLLFQNSKKAVLQHPCVFEMFYDKSLENEYEYKGK